MIQPVGTPMEAKYRGKYLLSTIIWRIKFQNNWALDGTLTVCLKNTGRNGSTWTLYTPPITQASMIIPILHLF